MDDRPNICVCGIDPGLGGATAFYFPLAPDRVAVDDMPIVAGEIDAAALAERIRQMKPDAAFVERIHFMPKSSKASVASMMQGYGALKAVLALCEVPLTIVTTNVWKKQQGLPLGAGMSERDKHEASRLRALQRFPKVADRFTRKLDHGRAEAALIARYGAETMLPRRAAA